MTLAGQTLSTGERLNLISLLVEETYDGVEGDPCNAIVRRWVLEGANARAEQVHLNLPRVCLLDSSIETERLPRFLYIALIERKLLRSKNGEEIVNGRYSLGVVIYFSKSLSIDPPFSDMGMENVDWERFPLLEADDL